MNHPVTLTATVCPSCGSPGKGVSRTTMNALLNDDQQNAIRDAEYRFCDSPGCDVVYFEPDGTRFTQDQLKVEVGVKETTGERPLCYCFGHSVASIKQELRTKGRSDATDDIRRKMEDPGCRCETENPAGSCCLGNVAKGIKIASEELSMSDTEIQLPARSSQSSTGKGEKIAKAGTLISAVMASVCCWLPLVLLTAGVSGAGIASTLEAYRPLFMVVTFGFLGSAFYFTYRPKKSAADCCAAEPSTGGDCCTPTVKGRINMKTLNKAMLWVVTMMAVAFLFFPSYVGVLFGGGQENAVTSDMNQAVIKVEGMTCEGCSVTVAKVIRGVAGVQAVQVSYEKREAVVGVEAGRPIPQAKILAALKEAGYAGTFAKNPNAN